MDHVYSVLRRIPLSVSSYQDCFPETGVVCSVSNRNTVAFTSSNDLEDCTNKMFKAHLYVADLNIPSEAYKVTSHNEHITCVEWDISGIKLLLADTTGNIQIWSLKDFHLNDWMLLSSSNFPGEHILSAIWFHNGKKMALNMDKKDSHQYLEKYQYIRFAPSVRQFGGKPCEGCIAISCSGLVCVMVLQPDGTCMTGCEMLSQFRSKIKVVDICYAKNGEFLVVTSDGHVQSSVHCYRVTVKVNPDKCVITCHPFSSFYPSSHAANSSQEKPSYYKISHLKFVLREAADAVVVAASGMNGSTVELWELREKPVTLHKMFQTLNSDTQPKTVGWQHHTSFTGSSPVVAITTPRLSVYDISPPPSYVIVAFKDNIIKCFYRESLQLVCGINVNIGNMRRDDHGIKAYVGHGTICNLQLTWTGCALVAIDNASQLFLYRLSPVTDPGTCQPHAFEQKCGPMSANYAITVLEYCLLTGTDWWDVILSLRPGLIESICEKLTESFTRQSSGTQQYWFAKFLALKGSLYRCLSNGQAKAGDCHSLIMLNAVAAAMKGLLRPRELSSQEKGPAENLTNLLSSKSADSLNSIHNVLLHLEYKEFTVEPPILQSLQHLTQWVADCALYILATLPSHFHNHMKFPGAGLISDTKALSTLRELLVIIRIWSLVNESCLPVFTKMTENLDVMSHLFKLLTKTLISHGSEPDETLFDECGLLPSQVLIPALELGINAQGVASPALFMNSLPLQFEYFHQPEFLRYISKSYTLEGAIPYHHKIDIVRHISLGANPISARQCTRCSSYSMVQTVTRSAATRAWDQRWMRFCPCGGHWKLLQIKK